MEWVSHLPRDQLIAIYKAAMNGAQLFERRFSRHVAIPSC